MCVCTLFNQKVIQVECVLIRARKNLSTSLDKGLGRGEQAETLERRTGEGHFWQKERWEERWPELFIVLGV